jgi:hypothetical protein
MLLCRILSILGSMKFGTNFQILITEVGGLFGLDFTYMDNVIIYHTWVSFFVGFDHT